jgi:hypothetical protein
MPCHFVLLIAQLVLNLHDAILELSLGPLASLAFVECALDVHEGQLDLGVGRNGHAKGK